MGLDKQIRDTRKQLGVCPNCGGTRNGRINVLCVSCGEKARITSHNWRIKNPERAKEVARNQGQRLKDRVFGAYGGYVCSCCNEIERTFLTIDHVNEDGAKHRRELNIRRKGYGNGHSMYRWIEKHSFPPTFQVLCMNCNWGKHRNGGICPHKEA